MSSTEYGPRPERITCKFSYIRTFPGILKIIQFVCDAAALILGLVAPSLFVLGQKGFIIFVAALALLLTSFLFLWAFLNIQAVCIPEYWMQIEMYWCLFASLLYLISGIISATIVSKNGIYGATAFFDFAALLAYLIDAANRFRLLHRGPLGRRSQTRETITTTTVTRQEPTF